MIADEVQRDLYGYTRHEVDPSRPAPVVVPVRFTDEAEAYDGFLRALGLTGTPEPGGYTTYVAPDGGGEVGVHYVYSDDLPVVRSEHAVAHLTFAITGGLDDLQQALQARDSRSLVSTRTSARSSTSPTRTASRSRCTSVDGGPPGP